MTASPYYVDEDSAEPAGVCVRASNAIGDENWQVEATFVMCKGQPVLADLRVLPRLPADLDAEGWETEFVPPDACLGGITTRLLRSIRLPELEQEARGDLETMARWVRPGRWRRKLED